ncbi:NAD-dependent epimerase/dehydratase family protein [Bacteroidota bacterium]
MILVTGGTGLVGSHLLLELTKKHDRVRAIHRPLSRLQNVSDLFALCLENPESQFRKIEWVHADVRDIDSLIKAMEGVEYVYHTAAFVSFNPGDRYGMIQNNVGGTANVVNACLEKKIRKLCYVSSTAALGSALPGKEITEDIIWTNSKSRSAYSLSKFNSEMEVWRGMAEGLEAVVVNPSIIVGPGDWKRSSSYLFSLVWKGIRFYTEGITGYVDVRDVIRSMVDLMNSKLKGERYTISSENLSYRQVLEMIAEALDKKSPRIRASSFLISLAWRMDWLSHAFRGTPRNITRDAVKSSKRKAIFSNRKIKEAIGIEFMPIDQSIKETARIFLRTHGSKA